LTKESKGDKTGAENTIMKPNQTAQNRIHDWRGNVNRIFIFSGKTARKRCSTGTVPT
jgi:hypothetical protein